MAHRFSLKSEIPGETRKNPLAGRKMKKLLMSILTVIAVFALKAHSQVVEPLKLIQTIPMPGLHAGDFDHFAVDLQNHRLFLAAEENSAVEVFDLRANKLIHSITGVKTPHSMTYRADLKKLFVVDGDAGLVKIYETDSYEPIGSIELKEGADSSTFDSSTKYMYVVNKGDDAHLPYSLISVIDTTAAKKLADIKIDSDTVEAMAIEKSSPRMFVNVTGKSAVAVIDREKRTVTATWPIGEEGKGNAAMAFDEANHRLFVVARYPGKLIVLDSDSGKIVATLPCVGHTDDAVYDPGSKRLYVSGVPFIYVYEERHPNAIQLLGQVPSAFHAVTAMLVPELHQYYLAVPRHGDTPAELQIYNVVP
jgi:DNA-binding beta-propeller fold protein YncE